MNLRNPRIHVILSVMFTLVLTLGVNQARQVDAAVISSNTKQINTRFQPNSPSDIPGVLGIPLMTGKPAVDGVCSVDEYAGTLVQTFLDGNGQTSTVYIGHNGFDLYICMQAQPGTFIDRFGSLYLDPQGDGSSYTYAQKDDYSLRVNIPGTTRTSYNGTGVANGYVLNSSLNSLWDGSSLADVVSETVEWRVSIERFGLGNCGAMFGLGVYHHWFAGVGDDYGWPSNKWFDQPRTWHLVYLLNGLCTPPPGEGGKIAYVFRGNTADATSFFNLLVTNGYTVTLVPLSDVLTTDFSAFDLILVADDTGSLNQWGLTGLTDSQVSQIKAGNKPIIGLGEGGYAFFGRLFLFIGWPNGWHGPDDNTANAGTGSAAAVFGALGSPLTTYNSPVNEASIYIQGQPLPSDVDPIGIEVPDTAHSNIILQGCRLLWGYSGNPLSMVSDGRSLFLNAVSYMRFFQCPSETPIEPGPCLQVNKSAKPAAGTPVHPGDVIEYTITYTFSDDPACQLPTQGRLTDYVPTGTEFIPGSASDGITPGPDGLLAWSVTAGTGQQTKTFSVQVVDAACTTGQIANRASLYIPGFAPLTTADVTHPVECGPITLPNDEPMFAEEEVNIYPYPLILGRPSQIEVALVNNSAVSQTVTIEFQTSPDHFGIGLTFNTFDTDVIIIPANSSAIARGTFTPSASGHYCIQIKITGPNLPAALYTQRNLDVTESLQGGVPDTLTFSVGNPTASTANVTLVVDNTCPGWSAIVTPSVLTAMLPGEVRTASLEVTPPNPVVLGSGCHIDVQGWIDNRLIGGIRKLDVPPVHLPTDVNPPWEEREISFAPETPIAGQPGQICVELQNPLAITQTVTVVFSVADFGAGIGFTPVTTQSFNLPPNSINKYCVPWTPSTSGTLHRCVLVTLQQPGYQDMFSQHNVDLRRIPSSGLGGLNVPFVIGNPDLVSHHLELIPTIYGLVPDWQVSFFTNPGDPPPDVLGPGESVNLNMILIGLNKNFQSITSGSKFGDVAKIEVAVLLDGDQVGGFTVLIDNLQLFLPLLQK
jgi:uncharacterized repeat protein (TIGR01451 family)